MIWLIWLLLQEPSGQVGVYDTKYVTPDIPLSFNAKDISVAEFLRQISREKKVNIIVEPGIQQKLTLKLEDTGLNDVLNLLVGMYGLNIEKIGDIIHVRNPIEPMPEAPTNEILFDADAHTIAFDLNGLELHEFSRQLTQLTKINVLVRDRTLKGVVRGFQAALPLERGLETLCLTNGFGFVADEDVYYITTPGAVTDQLEATANSASAASNTERPLGLSQVEGKWSAAYVDAPIETIVQDLRKTGSISVTVLGKLEGNLTIDVIDVTLEQLFRLMLANSDYSFVKRDDIYIVGSKTSPALYHSELVAFDHINAEMIQGMLPASLTDGITVTMVKELNSLLLTGEHGRVNQLEELAKSMDQNVPQVLIEVMVVDFTFTDDQEIGLSFTNGDNQYFPELDVTVDGVLDSSGNFQIRRLPSNFSLHLRALETQGKAKIISKPHIAALNGHEAEIKIGTKQFYRIQSEELVGNENPRVRTSEQIREIEASIYLKITPWVTGNGEVTTLIEPSFTTFLGQVSDNIPPPISTRELKSTVRLRDGETIILGGLIENFDTITLDGVPFISKVPLLGALFRRHDRSERKSELVIYLTPHVYYGGEGSVEFIREHDGLDYQLDVKRQKKGIPGEYPEKESWWQRWKRKRREKQRQPEALQDPRGDVIGEGDDQT